MRMRTKKWAIGELNSSEYYIKSEEDIDGRVGDMFIHKNPINVEVGCGKGVFTSKIAAANKNINYFGIDLSTDVLGCAKRNIDKEYDLKKENIDNILIMRYKAEDLSKLFSKNDNVKRIYINFCNPWQKSKHNKRRLTYPKQLEVYKSFLSDDGTIYFKTDNIDLFNDSILYIKESGFNIVRKTYDLHKENYTDESIITTEHEEMFTKEGKKICFLEATLAE